MKDKLDEKRMFDLVPLRQKACSFLIDYGDENN